jgi:serine protease Do
MRRDFGFSLFTVAAGLAVIGASPRVSGGPLDPEPGQAAPARIYQTTLGTGSYLGVGIAEMTSDRAKELKLREEYGVEITRVDEDSPAANAGLKTGDVVLEYNGQKVEGMEQFSRLVRETPPGREVKVLVSRNGANQTVMVKVGNRKPMRLENGYGFTMPRVEIPQMPDMPRSIMMWRSPMLGIEGESLHGQLAEYFGVKDGVLVRSVMKDTPAAKAGIKAGDVILKVDDSKVTSPSEVTSIIRSRRGKKTLPVVVMRDHKETTLTAPVDDSGMDDEHMARPVRAHAE